MILFSAGSFGGRDWRLRMGRPMGGRSAQLLRQCSERRADVCVRRLFAEQAGGCAVKETLSSDGMVRKNAVSAHMAVVKDSLLCDRDVVYCDGVVSSPTSCGGCTVPIGVQCAEVGNSVLCNFDSVKDPSAGDMGLKQGYEPSYCKFCVMNHSLTCKVTRAGDQPKDQGSRKMNSVENSSLCDVQRARCSGPCNEFEDTSWEDQGRTCVKDGDSLCNWRRRRRGIVWWLLLVLLGAAPLASGQLRPNTDITTSRTEGGKLCIW
jgi:hypothetical protein